MAGVYSIAGRELSSTCKGGKEKGGRRRGEGEGGRRKGKEKGEGEGGEEKGEVGKEKGEGEGFGGVFVSESILEK